MQLRAVSIFEAWFLVLVGNKKKATHHFLLTIILVYAPEYLTAKKLTQTPKKTAVTQVNFVNVPSALGKQPKHLPEFRSIGKEKCMQSFEHPVFFN